MIQMMSGMSKEFVASQLRSQINSLNEILKNIENEDAQHEYAQESLKRIESSLRKIRKLCEQN